MNRLLSQVRSWAMVLRRGVVVVLVVFLTASMAQGEDRKHLVIILAEAEYGTPETLPKFAGRFLSKDFRVSFVNVDPKDPNRLIGLSVIGDADLILISVRRRAFPKKQLDSIRKFIAAGKPVVGIRTASHAFSLRGGSAPKGHVEWPEFDRDVLGGNYNGHYAKNRGAGPSTMIKIAAKAVRHPILKGISRNEIPVSSWLYKTEPLGPKANILMTGRAFDPKTQAPVEKSLEPVAWTNTNKFGGRVFYTSLGHKDEFEFPAFQRLLVNGIYWTAGIETPKDLDSRRTGAQRSVSAENVKP